MLKRRSCLICDEHLELIHIIKNFPIYVGIQVDNIFSTEDMNWAVCSKCGCIQLQELVEPEILYKIQHNPAIGKTWLKHNELFSNYVIKSGVKNLLDIGGANLKIATIVAAAENVETYTVVDTAVDQYPSSSNNKIKTIKGFIEDITLTKEMDGVILSHTFEHFYEPVKILKRLSEYLTPGGKVFISVPNMENQLKKGFLNALSFEHTFYINPDYMKLCASNAGFEVVDVTNFSEYTTFYTLQKTKNLQKNIFDYTSAKTIFFDHVNGLTKDVKSINLNIYDKKVYCFGAHIFTQALLSAGLLRQNIIAVLDNDVDKVGHILYGTGLSIQHPSVISSTPCPYVILRTAQYTEEIKEELLKYNPQVIFI